MYRSAVEKSSASGDRRSTRARALDHIDPAKPRRLDWFFCPVSGEPKWLSRTGLIDSAEVRLPMVEVSAAMATRLDAEINRRLAVMAGSRRLARKQTG